tara:strand:+ start:6294 stop:6494 length:201 start_codon:yes stop_codon:yes gene_type:complete
MYEIRHARHGCYEVILKKYDKLGKDDKFIYLTNFRNKKAAQKFIKAHENDEVVIDPETCIPTPDFK